MVIAPHIIIGTCKNLAALDLNVVSLMGKPDNDVNSVSKPESTESKNGKSLFCVASCLANVNKHCIPT